MQATSGTAWLQLPYEVAHGVAKLVVLHGSEVIQAKKDLANQLLNGSEEKKTRTQKAREAVEKLKSVERFLVFNRRTGQLATADWIQKHICSDEHGRPKVRNPKSTAKPWLMTMKFQGDEHVKISLRTDDVEGSAFRQVRCLSLTQGIEKADLQSLVSGYQHLVVNEEEGDDDGQDMLSRFPTSNFHGTELPTIQTWPLNPNIWIKNIV